jgi:colicin import membrane protein
MTKKSEEKETTDVAVFNVETFKANQLPELIGKRDIQQKIIDDNPYVEIIDTTTHEQAKKARTALRLGRTSMANEKKMVIDRLKQVVVNGVSAEYDELEKMPTPAENKQQEEIYRWDNIKKAEKSAKEKAEQDRIDAIKATIELFRNSWKKTIDSMLFDEIEATTAEFDKVVTEYDKAPLEEFSVIFNRNLSDLELALLTKLNHLTQPKIYVWNNWHRKKPLKN